MGGAGAPYRVRLLGRYVKGLGRAGAFLSMEVYREILSRRLGSDPYPGTLNIEVEGLGGYRELRRICPPEDVGDIEVGGRIFGGLHIWRGSIGGERVLVIRPYRSAHPENVLEVVSREKLAERLKIEEGQAIAVDIECLPE